MNRAPRCSHVIFDLDGTLLDSEPAYHAAAELVCARYGANFTLELKRAITGGDSLRGAELVVRTLQLPLTPRAYLAEREVELERLFPTVAPIPHAVELVNALRTHGVPLAIATSGHRRVTEAKLAFQPFLQSIPVRVCGDDARLARGKPAPDIFLLAARELDADPARCVVIEDSVLGVQAATAAGMHTIALVDPRYFTDDQFAAAAQRVHSLGEVDLEALGLAGSSPLGD